LTIKGDNLVFCKIEDLPDNSIILPIFYSNSLKNEVLRNANIKMIKEDYYLDYDTLSIRTTNSNWVVARFGTNNLYSDSELLVDYHIKNILGINLEKLLKNSTYHRLINEKNTLDLQTYLRLKSEYSVTDTVIQLKSLNYDDYFSKINEMLYNNKFLKRLKAFGFYMDFPEIKVKANLKAQKKEKINITMDLNNIDQLFSSVVNSYKAPEKKDDPVKHFFDFSFIDNLNDPTHAEQFKEIRADLINNLFSKYQEILKTQTEKREEELRDDFTITRLNNLSTSIRESITTNEEFSNEDAKGLIEHLTKKEKIDEEQALNLMDEVRKEVNLYSQIKIISDDVEINQILLDNMEDLKKAKKKKT